MIYSEKILGEILRKMYDNAPRNEQVLMIHLFGIKYGGIMEENGFKSADIIKAANMNESYKTEVSKGIKLGKYVEIKKDKDIF